MGAAAVVCYKTKPQAISKEYILKALNDKIIKETISPFSVNSGEPLITKGEVHNMQASSGITQDNTKATSTAMNVKTEDQRLSGVTGNDGSQNFRQRVVRGGRLTPHLQMDTVGD